MKHKYVVERWCRDSASNYFKVMITDQQAVLLEQTLNERDAKFYQKGTTGWKVVSLHEWYDDAMEFKLDGYNL